MNQQKSLNFKCIDLSSQSQSDNESDKQNFDSRAQSKLAYSVKGSHQPVTHDQRFRNQHSSIINQAKSVTPMKDCQFSTLSLDDPSFDQYDDRVQSFYQEKNHLLRENQDLKRLNKELQFQITHLTKTTTNYSFQICNYEQRISDFQQEISHLKDQINTIQNRHSRSIKEYQNKLTNYQLPGNKHWIVEIEKIYSQIKDKIHNLSSVYLNLLAKERMNSNVEAIISKFVNQLTSFQPTHSHQPTPNCQNNENIDSKFKNRNSSTVKPYRSKRINDLSISIESEPKRQISQDYKLLEKSIQKLKVMEKEIDKSSGSYLKRRTEEELTPQTKSVLLDQSSILALDRSKSRRKRIFQ